MRKVFDFIPPAGSPPSEPELYVRKWRSGEITTEEMNVAQAFWVATHSFKYEPRLYPEPDRELRNYIETRLRPAPSERQAKLSSLLGLWIEAVVRIRHQNSGDLELLLWCAEQLKKAKGDMELHTIERCIVYYRDLEKPDLWLEHAIEVQRKDSDDKRRNIEPFTRKSSA